MTTVFRRLAPVRLRGRGADDSGGFPARPQPGQAGSGRLPADQAACREQLKQRNLNRLTIGSFARLRALVPAGRRVIYAGDGGFTNHTVINGRPAGTVYIGCTRKDLALYYPPDLAATIFSAA